LYGLAFLLALALRLIRLGAFPLTDTEAASALQALQVAQGARPLVGPNSAYVLLTGIFFFLFESSNFLARFVPALAGAFLVFVPLLFRGRLKPTVALVLAFFLAVDTGLLALSRQAGSSILAVTFLLFAWGFWEHRWTRLAGVFAAAAILSGTTLWAGLLGLALSWAILQSLERTPAEKTPQSGDDPDSTTSLLSSPSSATDTEPPQTAPSTPLTRDSWKPALQAFIVTFVLFGTLVFTAPGGLNGALAALLEYVRGWVAPSNVPGAQVFLSLLFYQPLTVLLALVAIVRGWLGGSRRAIRLSVWMLVALLLAVFYPAHQVHDLVWALIPLSALAALELSRHFDLRSEERVEVGGVIVLTVLILAFAWLDLASIPWTPGPSGETNLRFWLLFGALFLLLISILLVAVGWSLRTARLGAVWGITIFLTLYTLAVGLAAGRLRVNYTSELWGAGPYPTHAKLLASTVADLSEWDMGQVDAVPVTIFNVDSPALRWALRSHAITVVNALDPGAAPPILITPLLNNPGLAASYRGQDFTWGQQPNWDSALSGDWLRWLVQREMPQTYDTILLWARTDLFIDAAHQNAP